MYDIVWNNVPIIPTPITWVTLTKLECYGLDKDFTGILARECGDASEGVHYNTYRSLSQLYEKAVVLTRSVPWSENVTVYVNGDIIATLKGQCQEWL